MSNAVTNNLSTEETPGVVSQGPVPDVVSEKIKQLLAAVGSRPADDAEQIEATEYNWHQPHCFSSDQLTELDAFLKETAATIAQKLAALCHSDFNVTIASTTQHFASELISQAVESEQNNYNLAFGTDDDHQCGFISTPPETAITWVTQLLGDSESEKDSSRDLSQLEESLLLDITSAIVEALSDSYESYDFHPAESIVRGQLPLELQGTEELCQITFNVEKADSENSSQAHLLILCDKLEPVVGKTAQAVAGCSAAEIPKAILNHLQQVPVSVTAQLASTMLTFEEIMSLQPCDVLLLDKKIDEPIELIVQGRTLLRGWPAKSAGTHAVVVTEAFCNTA